MKIHGLQMAFLATPLLAAANLAAVNDLAAQEGAGDILAAQIRSQGYRCETPVNAQRDLQLSRPDGAAWVLSCKNATYRMRLVPNMAAHVEQLN